MGIEIREFFYFLIFILTVATLFRIFLRENRTPASRIAWVFVVATLPVFGLIIYVVLGEVNPGRKYNERLRKNVRELYRRFGGKQTGNWEKSQKLLRNPHFYNVFSYSKSIRSLHPVGGNVAELMPEDDPISRLIEDIDHAKHSFHGIYYIWLDDNTGRALGEALMRAAKRGVKCRVIADGMGSRRLFRTQFWQDMIDAGVDAQIALPIEGIRGLLSARVDLRNHRKITVIDNEIAYIGSRNIADPEFRIKPRYAPWEDILVRFEGPIVSQNNLLFMSDWMMVSDEKIEEIYDTNPNAEKKDGFLSVVVPDGPDLRIDAIPQLYELMFAAAQKDIHITTPYFVPNEGLVDSMSAAAYAGKRVTLNLTKKNDSFVVAATAKSYYRELLKAGVEIYEYEKGILHSKIAIVDQELVMIGSTNLDRRSFDLNYENNVLLEDADLAKDIHERQQIYFAHSKQITLEDVEDWGMFKRAWNNLMAVLSPIL